MALDSTIAAIIYAGNASTSTPYPVPFTYLDSSHVVVSKTLQGTGTVTVAAGVVTFSSAQSALVIGSRIRIAGVNYEIATRASDTSFTFRTRPTISATTFHHLESATELALTTDYTLGTSGVVTVAAIPATALVTIFRRTPVTQPTELPSAGALPSDSLELMADRLTMVAQELTSVVQGTGVGKADANGAPITDTATFADATARAAAVPTRVGQIGVQLSDKSVWTATATTAGAWSITSTQVRTFANNGAMQAATPNFVGELAVVASDFSMWVGWLTTVGCWTLAWTAHPNVWHAMPWRHNEPVIPESTRRWAGTIPRQIIVEKACIFVSQVGIGSLKVKLHLPYSGRQVTTSEFTLTQVSYAEKLDSDITASVIGTLGGGGGSLEVWAGGISEDAAAGAFGMERVEVEIVSAGSSSGLTVAVGSNLSTPAGGTFTNALTGTRLSVPNQNGDIFVIANGGSQAALSHPSNQAGSITAIAAPRLYTVGASGLSAVAGATTITVTAAEVAMIQPGMQVYGATVQPGTVVQTVTPGGPSITINKPLTGATSMLAVVDPYLPAIQRHTGLSALTGATTITVPHTTGLSVGDSVRGTNVAANTYISAIPGSTQVTLSAAITGGISELWFTVPTRPATAFAGDTVIPLTNTVGIKVGMLVTSGAGVPPGTYVTAVSSPNVTLSQKITSDIASEAFSFSSEKMQVTGAITSGSADITLPYSVSSTPIAAGHLVTGDGVPPGTFVQSVAGSKVTCNNAMNATNAAVTLQIQQNPQWLGLEVGIVGHYISITPPR